MIITELPEHLIIGQKVKLLAPDVLHYRDVYTLISNFTKAHHEFLLWSNSENSIDTCYKNLEIASSNFKNDKNEYRFLIMDIESNNLVGCISLFIINPKIPFYEIGYWISSQSMGRGFVTEACALVKYIACHYLKCERLEIKMASRNIPSAKVALRTGFQLEARLRKHRLDGFGHIDDTCIYSYPI
ncbi:GNAT family N-acetyltransferase [Serratia ureilytica]|uniref:GNAT family N-acetyltransferase n=1 Tax=Serratia ureilytica TaxID=300181 RepID=UPI001AA132CD|nr:GNAT family protein [Serratia ureilytica]MBO1811490.1 GNAT family N-acetyltransferase [Serratia ureilytica]